MIYIITHASCVDGSVSAWVIKRYLDKTNPFEKVKIIYAKYRDIYKDIFPYEINDLNNSTLYIVDYTYTADVISKLKCKRIIIIDHHKSMENELIKCKSLLNCEVHFDLSKCGCTLAWTLLFDENIPWWLLYVEDRDLFKWKLPNSREINEAIFNKFYPDEHTYNSLMTYSKYDINKLIGLGRRLLDNKKKLVSKYKINKIKFRSYTCGILNIKHNITDIYLHNMYNYDMMIFYSYNHELNTWVVKMRSHIIDVQSIAKLYNGGGHEGAASFNYDGDIMDLFYK